MKTHLNIMALGLSAAAISAAAFFAYAGYRKLSLATGFAAKNLCSAVFVAGREQTAVEKEDNAAPFVRLAGNTVDREEKSVTSSLFGLAKRKAVYRSGLGCVLLPAGRTGVDYALASPARSPLSSGVAFPFGAGEPQGPGPENVDYAALEKAVGSVFDAPGESLKQTRAVLVIHKDRLIAERYAPGFGKDTRLAGWSMTKSLTGGLAGVLSGKGLLNVASDGLFSDWQADGRSKIKADNLLRMNSGLEWKEDYGSVCDVTEMLFSAQDMAGIQRAKPLAASPGAVWNYSSGTTNLLSAYMRALFKNGAEYRDFWYRELVDRIGMSSMVLEADLAGNYVGSSYAWATARDWSKFGLLYLRQGKWKGETVLPGSWVKYSVTPSSGSEGAYGAQFWLNAGGAYPNAPSDLFSCNGHQGQYIFIVPSKDAVIVRLGLAGKPPFRPDPFLRDVLAAIK